MAAINFTVAVPDDWWVDSWSNNDTLSFTYPDGAPTHFQYIHDQSTGDYLATDIFRDSNNLREEETIQMLSAVDYPEVATWLHIKDTTHTFDDVSMGDGSTYKKINNPTLRDLFDIEDSGGKPVIKAKVKALESVIEKKVKIRK